MREKIRIIEACSENGAGLRGASLGPKAVMLEALQQNINLFKKYDWIELDTCNSQFSNSDKNPYAKNIVNIKQSLGIVCNEVENTLASNLFPLILSGDHSNAIGSISGVKNHFHDKEVGVIWVDAHLDLHSPFTTPSGNMHGMALNALINDDNTECKIHDPSQEILQDWKHIKELGSKRISPKINAANLVFIGTRDFEEEEQHLVEKYSMKVFDPDEIREYGIIQVIEQSLKLLDHCDVIYVSFDVDSQDTTISTGTGTPVEGGLFMPEAEEVFNRLFHHPKVVAFEISEINPMLDRDNSMAKAVVHLLSGVI